MLYYISYIFLLFTPDVFISFGHLFAPLLFSC